MPRYLIRNFAIVCGKSIQNETLRQAVLAFSASIVSQSRFGDASERHVSNAYRRLISKLSKPETVNDTDVFASYMLMRVSWNQNR